MKNKMVLLFIILIGIIGGFPYIAQGELKQLSGSLFIAGTMVFAVYACSVSRRDQVIAVLLAVPWTLMFLGETAHILPGGYEIKYLPTLTTAFFLFTSYSLFKGVRRAGVVNLNVIAAALSVYILIGFTFSVLYNTIEAAMPGSFNFPGNLDYSRLQWTDFLYFSFVTQTTLGYGDISPASAAAQSMVVIQALFGVFYLAVLVSRLVGLYKSENGLRSD